jgi:hypothetical protein
MASNQMVPYKKQLLENANATTKYMFEQVNTLAIKAASNLTNSDYDKVDDLVAAIGEICVHDAETTALAHTQNGTIDELRHQLEQAQAEIKYLNRIFGKSWCGKGVACLTGNTEPHASCYACSHAPASRAPRAPSAKPI